MSSLNEDLALKYLIRLPRRNTPEKPLFIFLHGFGSNERDLFSLSDLLPDNFTVISARSPYSLDRDSYSFYHIDYSTGKKVIDLEQAEKSRVVIKGFIDQLTDKYRTDSGEVYLGGFSQGAIMSFSVALTFPGTIKAVAALSSYILNEIKPKVRPDESLKNIKVFMSHGIYDEVIPVKQAREAKEHLSSLSITPEYHEFSGGHEIPENILKYFYNWVKQ